MNRSIYKLSESEKKIIELILNNGNRVELIPCKESVKIMKISRNEVKDSGTNGNKAGNRSKND